MKIRRVDQEVLAEAFGQFNMAFSHTQEIGFFRSDN
jgi:hypothetical protein